MVKKTHSVAMNEEERGGLILKFPPRFVAISLIKFYSFLPPIPRLPLCTGA